MREQSFLPGEPNDPALFQPRDFLDAAAFGFPPRMSENLYNAIFRAAGRRYGLSPALLKAISVVLSGKRADFVSAGGRIGIMQLPPEVARSLKLQDPFDPVENIFGAARYLRQLLDRYRGNFSLALAAYYGQESFGAGGKDQVLVRDAEEFVTRVLALAAEEAGRCKERTKGELFAELAQLLKNGKGGT